MRKAIVALIAGGMTLAGPAAFAAPANDDFEGATVIASAPFGEGGVDTSGATFQAGEPESACGPLGATVWYRYTPPDDVTLTAETTMSDYDTVLAAYRGTSFGDLQELACNDDQAGPDDLTSLVSFDAAAGDTLYFQVGGYEGATGALTFTLNEGGGGGGGGGGPVNDDLADATLIQGVPFNDLVDLAEATVEDGEPAYCFFTEHTVWYRLDAQADLGLIAGIESGFNADASLTIYRGTNPGDFQFVDCASAYEGTASLLLGVESGATYYFQVDNLPYSPDAETTVAFSLEEAPSTDLAITSLSVENVPFQTDFGSVPSSITRKVHVTVSNLSDKPAGAGAYFFVEACPRTTGFCDYPAYYVDATVQPGASLSRTFNWYGRGVGDYDVRAYVYPGEATDVNPENNEATVEHYLVIGGTGVGVGVGGECVYLC